MRITLSFLLLLTYFSSKAQLLDPSAEWFELNDFFEEQVVKNRAITHLRIKVSSKSDGKIIEDSGEELFYAFNASGQLLEAKKRIPLYRGYDTARVVIQYDRRRRMIRKYENYGPYHFDYLYQYTTDSTFNSIKLRLANAEYDTLYFRRHLVEKIDQTQVEKVSNRNGVVFLSKRLTYNELEKPLEEELDYVFSRHQSKTEYSYAEGKLIEMRYEMNYGQGTNSLKKFEYLDGLLEEVRHYENDQLTKRITFTYANNLPSAAIMRIVEEKEIKIFIFEYTFY
jgi:hypothetical protein